MKTSLITKAQYSLDEFFPTSFWTMMEKHFSGKQLLHKYLKAKIEETLIFQFEF